MKIIDNTLEICEALNMTQATVTPIWYKTHRNDGKPYYAYITLKESAVVPFGTWIEILEKDEYIK